MNKFVSQWPEMEVEASLERTGKRNFSKFVDDKSWPISQIRDEYEDRLNNEFMSKSLSEKMLLMQDQARIAILTAIITLVASIIGLATAIILIAPQSKETSIQTQCAKPVMIEPSEKVTPTRRF